MGSNAHMNNPLSHQGRVPGFILYLSDSCWDILLQFAICIDRFNIIQTTQLHWLPIIISFIFYEHKRGVKTQSNISNSSYDLFGTQIWKLHTSPVTCDKVIFKIVGRAGLVSTWIASLWYQVFITDIACILNILCQMGLNQK